MKSHSPAILFCLIIPALVYADQAAVARAYWLAKAHAIDMKAAQELAIQTKSNTELSPYLSKQAAQDAQHNDLQFDLWKLKRKHESKWNALRLDMGQDQRLDGQQLAQLRQDLDALDQKFHEWLGKAAWHEYDSFIALKKLLSEQADESDSASYLQLLENFAFGVLKLMVQFGPLK